MRLFNKYKAIRQELKILTKNNNINNSMIGIYLDLFYSRFVYRLSVKEYVRSAYKYSRFIKKNMMSSRNDKVINKIFNNVNYIHFLENKIDFLKYFATYIKRDWIYPKENTLENFLIFSQNVKSIIIKPIDSLQGKGVKKIDLNDYSKNELENLFYNFQEENILVEECITQHPELIFNNKSVNTIRIFTIMDKNGDVHILKTVLRVGKGDNIVDNFCAGGIVYPIDKETGIIDGKGIDNYGNTYIYHACSNIQMIGKKIPYWNDVLSTTINAAKEIKEVRYIGWDIVVTPNGIDIIEANHNPDTDFLEFIGENAFLPKILKYK